MEKQSKSMLVYTDLMGWRYEDETRPRSNPVVKVICLRCGYECRLYDCSCLALTIVATLDRIEARQGARVRDLVAKQYGEDYMSGNLGTVFAKPQS